MSISTCSDQRRSSVAVTQWLVIQVSIHLPAKSTCPMAVTRYCVPPCNLSTFDQTIRSSSRIKILRAGGVRQVSHIFEVSMQGTIKRLLRDRGFGFIRCSDGQEVFFHRNGLQQIAFEDLQEGTNVEFEVERGERGPRATNVRLSTMV